MLQIVHFNPKKKKDHRNLHKVESDLKAVLHKIDAHLITKDQRSQSDATNYWHKLKKIFTRKSE